MSRAHASVLTIITVLAFAAPASAVDFNVTIGLDSQGTFNVRDIDESFDYDSANGYTLGFELEFDVPLFELGVGLEYGFSRGPSCGSCSGGDLDYRLLYGIARFHVLGPLYLAGRVGYTNVSISDLESGIDGKETWGAGVGFSFIDRLKLELLFNNIAASNSDFDLDYDFYSLRLIYTF
ncbi:MAG: outer membrane beta-barrel protein [bacterium]|nr:outer membrane beta-barrel protein [bacterium]